MADAPKQWRVRIGGEREMVSGFTAIGRAIGGTVGQITHFVSAAARLGARLGPLGIAIGGVAAGAVALGKAISDLANKDIENAIKKADAASKSFGSLRDEINKVIERKSLEAAGVGDLGEQLLKAKAAYRDLDMARADIEAQIKRIEAEGAGAGTFASFVAEAKLKDLRQRLQSILMDLNLARLEIQRLSPMAAKETAGILAGRESKGTPARGAARAPGVDLDAAIRDARAQEEYQRRQVESARYWLNVELDLQRQLGEQQLAWQDELNARMYAKAEDAARARLEMEAEAQRQHAETVRMGAEMLVSAIDIGIGRGAAAMAGYISRELRALGMSESVKALVSLAAGDIAGAGKHAAAAAAAFAGSATVAALFPGGGGGGGAGSSPAARAAAQGAPVETQPSGGSVTIIINGDLLGDEGSGRRIAEYLESYADRQNPGRRQTKVKV